MFKLMKKALLIVPAAVGTTIATATGAIAQSTVLSASELLQQVESYSAEGSSSLGQFTGASQFSDVSPSDWAFQALDELIQRYDCLKGYPDGSYRGGRALSRYEFAAGLNACLQQIERLIAETTADFVTRDDLEAIRRLMEDFEAELAALGTRVDSLESRVAFLEDNQFSTTTKLVGEVVWTLGAAFGGDDATLGPNATAGNSKKDELTFDYRARFAFDTSFTGEDRLRTRLDTGNGDPTGYFAGGSGTPNGALNFYSTDGNDVNIDKVWYSFPINDSIQAHVVARGALVDDIFDMTTASYAYDDVPIGLAYNTAFYDVGTVGGGAAVAFNFAFSDSFGLDIGYFANESNVADQGLFSGNFGIPVQLNFSLGDLSLAAGYMYAYGDGGLGTASTAIAIDPFGTAPTTSSHYMLAASYDLSESVNLSAFVNFVNAVSEATPSTGLDADIWSWAFNVSFPDLAQEGDVLRLGFGRLPTALKVENTARDADETYMANVEYRFNLIDNIQLAPSFYVVFNPNGNSTNDTIYAGVLRTVFRF